MTILNINKFYFIRGGAERFFFELAKLLEEKGHQVIPFSMKHKNNFKSDYEKYFVSEVQTEKVSISLQGLRTVGRFFWSFEAQRKLKKIVKNEKPELAILHNIYHQISPSILPILKKYNIPIILIAHDYGLLSANYNMFVKGMVYDKICGSGFLNCLKDKCVKDSWLASLVCGLETWFHHQVLDVYKKNIDRVIAPSKFMREMFIKADWRREKLAYLPYFIKQPTFNNQQLTKKGEYILYFGRLSQEKGVDVLIKAMKNLPDINLKIVGSGPEESKVKKQIINNKIDNIEMLGYKAGKELERVIAGSQFVIVPSVWYENCPMSVLEAYSLGVPALVSNIGGLPEMIPSQDKNFMFQPANEKDLQDKIRFLWNNQEILNRAGKRVKEFVQENNNPEKYYEKLMGIYKNIS